MTFIYSPLAGLTASLARRRAGRSCMTQWRTRRAVNALNPDKRSSDVRMFSSWYTGFVPSRQELE